MSKTHTKWKAAVAELDRLEHQAEWSPDLTNRIRGQKNLLATLAEQCQQEEAAQVVEQDPWDDPRNEAVENDERMREARA